MEDRAIVYRGNARVSLQGVGALQPIEIDNPDYYTYFVGTADSSIKVRDHRQEPNRAALEEIENRSVGEFADVFNQPAEVEIRENDGEVEIEMLPGRFDTASPILWMGVIYDRQMPVHNITWEALKPLGNNATAFAVLVTE